MKITRLLLGVVAPLALAAPALAQQAGPAGSSASAEAAAAPSDGAATPSAAQPARTKHTVALGPEGTDDHGRKGRIHTVVRGDTLWDISEAYLGSAWVWPSIWKANPSVANPNRIFPGERLWIAPGEMRQVSDAEAARMTGREQPPASTGDVSPQPMRMLSLSSLPQVDFIDPQRLASAGALLGSPDQEKMLSQFRRVYVGMGEGQVSAGDRFTIVRPGPEVRDPASNRVLGYHIDKLGWLEITKVGPESSEAVIRESWSDIVRSDRLVPYVEMPKEIAVHPAPSTVEGVIVLQPEDRRVTAHFDIVYLNRGSEQGLEVGNPLEVYEPGAMATDAETGVAHRLPDTIVANLVVISVEPQTAVAVVTHVNRELERGEPFRPTDDEKSSFGLAQSAPLDATQWTARTIETGASKGGPKGSSPAKLAPSAKR